MQLQVDDQVVVFTLGADQYAVGISTVKEVVNWMNPRPVPHAPEMVEGVIDLRGDVIPVVDLAKRLKASRAKPSEEARIMIMEIGDRPIGLVVDDVIEVLKVAEGKVSPPSPVAQNEKDPIVKGVLKAENRLLILLDAAQLVAGSGAQMVH